MKFSRQWLDPQLREFFDDFDELELSDSSIDETREAMSSNTIMADALAASVIREEILIPGLKGCPDVRALLYKPTHCQANTAAYLHMHGGGLVLGVPEDSDFLNVEICSRLGIIVVSIEYQLAPEHPYPAALFDCYAALKYLHLQSNTLDVDPERIAIGGVSAGGGLAASLAIFARDENEYAICHQQLMYPMLDNRTGVDGKPKDPRLGEYCWTRNANVYGWDSYLGDTAAEDAYVPALSSDLSNLPPAWIGVGDLDLFLPENRLFAKRLDEAGIDVALNVYAGAPHAFNAVEKADVTQQMKRDFFNALEEGLRV